MIKSGFFTTFSVSSNGPVWFDEHIERIKYFSEVHNLKINISKLKSQAADYFKSESYRFSRLLRCEKSEICGLHEDKSQKNESPSDIFNYRNFGKNSVSEVEKPPYLHRGRVIVDTSTGKYEFTSDTVKPLKEPVLCRLLNIENSLGKIKKWPFRNLGIPEGGELILVHKKTGEVLEGNFSNIFLRQGDKWLTPLAGDRILNGICRQKFINFLKSRGKIVKECSIKEKKLCESHIFLSNSLRGVMHGIITNQDG